MKLSHVIPSALMASSLMLTPQTAIAQEDTAIKIEQICDENGKYLHPPAKRSLEVESRICHMEKLVNFREKSLIAMKKGVEEMSKSELINSDDYAKLEDFIPVV